MNYGAVYKNLVQLTSIKKTEGNVIFEGLL